MLKIGKSTQIRTGMLYANSENQLENAGLPFRNQPSGLTRITMRYFSAVSRMGCETHRHCNITTCTRINVSLRIYTKNYRNTNGQAADAELQQIPNRIKFWTRLFALILNNGRSALRFRSSGWRIRLCIGSVGCTVASDYFWNNVIGNLHANGMCPTVGAQIRQSSRGRHTSQA